MDLYLDKNSQPKGFEYPNGYIRLVEQKLVNLTPWRIMDGELLKNKFTGIKKRYPDKNLVPFATRIDNDDVACFDLANENKVLIIHDFANAGWEERKRFDSIWEWFKQAIDDMIEYDA